MYTEVALSPQEPGPGTPLPAPAYAAETWQVEKVGIILLANNKTNKSPQEAEQCWVPARAATN